MKKKLKIKLKINGADDRRELVAILAENGYQVSIQEVKDNLFNSNYYVVIFHSERKEEE